MSHLPHRRSPPVPTHVNRAFRRRRVGRTPPAEEVPTADGDDDGSQSDKDEINDASHSPICSNAVIFFLRWVISSRSFLILPDAHFAVRAPCTDRVSTYPLTNAAIRCAVRKLP